MFSKKKEQKQKPTKINEKINIWAPKEEEEESYMYMIWPRAEWALARTFSRIRNGPKPHSESILVLCMWLISPYMTVHCLFRIARAWNNVPPLWLGIALGSIAAGWPIRGRTQFQSHYHHFKQDRFYVRNNHIGPHPHEWDQNVIMKPPQTSS